MLSLWKFALQFDLYIKSALSERNLEVKETNANIDNKINEDEKPFGKIIKTLDLTHCYDQDKPKAEHFDSRIRAEEKHIWNKIGETALVSEPDMSHLASGKQFINSDTAMNLIKIYEQNTYFKLSTDSKNSKQIVYKCIRGKELRKSRSKGIRQKPSNSKSTDCGVYVRFSIRTSGITTLTSLNLSHNHAQEWDIHEERAFPWSDKCDDIIQKGLNKNCSVRDILGTLKLEEVTPLPSIKLLKRRIKRHFM